MRSSAAVTVALSHRRIDLVWHWLEATNHGTETAQTAARRLVLWPADPVADPKFAAPVWMPPRQTDLSIRAVVQGGRSRPSRGARMHLRIGA